MTWKQVNKVWYSSTLEIVNARVSLENRRALLNAATSTSLWLHRNPLRQLSKDGNLHGSGMSQATTTSPKPSSRVPWMVTPYFSSEEMLDGQHQGVDIPPCPCHNCSQGPPAEKTGRGSLLNHPLCPPDNSIGQGTELN